MSFHRVRWSFKDKGKEFTTSNKWKQVNNSWSTKGGAVKGGIFQDKLDILQQGSYALSNQHRRLMIEDVMELEKGDSVVLNISTIHPFFKLPGSKVFVENMKRSMEFQPLKPWLLGNQTFFAVNAVVSATPSRDSLIAKSLTIKNGTSFVALSICP